MPTAATTRKEQRRTIAEFAENPADFRGQFEALVHMPSLIHLDGIDFPAQPRGYALKRLLDIGASGAGLIFVAPLILLGWLAVKLTSEGPGFYWSERVGFGGRIFAMPKLRSMTVAAPRRPREGFDGADNHITPVGAFLRRTSIDELPQLWSVLVGHMSLIGPRPLLPDDPGTLVRARRHPEVFYVRPGITGLSQVNGRNHVHARRKARYDSVYAQRCTFMMDIFILRRTARVVLLAEGIL